MKKYKYAELLATASYPPLVKAGSVPLAAPHIPAFTYAVVKLQGSSSFAASLPRFAYGSLGSCFLSYH